MSITRTDRALIIRVGVHLRTAAQLEFNGYGQNWGADAKAREAKKRYDRLRRDERDLEALRKRREAQVPPAPPAGSGG
mgnify:CR=1 FL=1